MTFTSICTENGVQFIFCAFVASTSLSCAAAAASVDAVIAAATAVLVCECVESRLANVSV